MTSYVTRAWSCTVRLVVEDGTALDPAAADLSALLDQVDAAASRFRADSALSLANTLAGRPVPVPKLLVELVGVALDAAADTDGLVDPTVGLTLRGLGYDRDIAELVGRDLAGGPSPMVGRDLASAPRVSRRNWRDVYLDREAGLLTVPVGTSLDLGATAKAYLADRAALALAARYSTGVLVELGGDLAVAGERDGGWCIAVAEREGETATPVTIHRGGLATSTTTIRRWRRGGADVHHIIDPRTGAPALTAWRTVSVYADTTLAANTASTAAIILGEVAPDWLAALGLSARLVRRDGVIVTTGQWPAPELVES